MICSIGVQKVHVRGRQPPHDRARCRVRCSSVRVVPVAPLPPETERFRAVTEAVTRAALSTVPVAGGALVELFQYVTNRGRAARMREWMEGITAEMERLGISVETLDQSRGFLDAIGPATRAAIETASPDKIKALRNAVLNATLAPDLHADRHAIMLEILIGLTATHIKLLKLFDDPRAWYAQTGKPLPNIMMGGQNIVVEDAYPELAADKTLLGRVTADLERERLSTIALNTLMSSDGVLSGRTLPLGTELLRFITAPEGLTR